MHKGNTLAAVGASLFVVAVLQAQRPSPDQVAKERAAAELEAPRLAATLELQPGMTVADVGAGFGAMSIVLARWLGSAGRVIATDIGADQLAEIRDYATRESVSNLTVLPGATASSNLPTACCDAVFMRDVYHHLTAPDSFNKSLLLATKPGGHLAVIDFLPRPGSKTFPGVNPNRGGHGIRPALVVDEVTAAGFKHVRTVDLWPDANGGLFLVLFQK
jgi:predicted methyltransferase